MSITKTLMRVVRQFVPGFMFYRIVDITDRVPASQGHYVYMEGAPPYTVIMMSCRNVEFACSSNCNVLDLDFLDLTGSYKDRDSCRDLHILRPLGQSLICISLLWCSLFLVGGVGRHE